MKIEKILVPTGGSVYSQKALQYAIIFAKKLNAKMLGLYVYDTRFFEGPLFHQSEDHFIPEPYFNTTSDILRVFEERAEKIREYFSSICQKEGIQCDFSSWKGSPSEEILEYSKGVDLVVMGKKGEHANWLVRHLGSVCTRVLHHMERPLLVVDNVQPEQIKRALLCYAGGFYSRKELELSSYLVLAAGVELSVLTIATKKTKAMQAQREAKQYFSEQKIKADYLLTIGQVQEEIKKIAKIEEADMIITGASLHKHYEDLISFSLADKILHESSIPVLFVR